MLRFAYLDCCAFVLFDPVPVLAISQRFSIRIVVALSVVLVALVFEGDSKLFIEAIEFQLGSCTRVAEPFGFDGWELRLEDVLKNTPYDLLVGVLVAVGAPATLDDVLGRGFPLVLVGANEAQLGAVVFVFRKP